ncbi:ATP-binding cassette sub-family B member 9 [Dissostichus eleginoides]|uniref:ABC-type oligopeptide transporter ABCB9 n=1 Tax=Dissostichus eleginoides TaxID=100907 RepID=A0AAD9BXA0_DISEL|nr:ATP-binding cassette sub-family B member 9 [Dissostichus eleginoides]
MLSSESLQVAEEEVVLESSSNKLGDIYTFVAKGCFPHTMHPLRKKNLKRYAQKFIIDEGKLYYVGPKKEEKREVVIEAERKRQIFLDCHFNDIGHHLGQKKTVHRIQSKYYWLGIIKDVIKVCDTCQHTERSKNLARTVRPIKVDAPWEIVGIDIIETQQGNSNVIVLIDYFSKWPEAFPVQRTDALSVAKCISKCIYRFGAPKTIVCTQNADFCDEVSERLSDRWSIVQAVSPLDPPQLNPLHDGSFSQLKEAVEQMVAEKQSQWDDFLDPVLFLFRTSSNPTTKFSPYSLMFSRKPDLPNQRGCGSEGMQLRGDAAQRGCSSEGMQLRGDAAAQRGCGGSEGMRRLRGDAAQRGCGSEGMRLRGDAAQRGCGSEGMRLRGDAAQRGCGSEGMRLRGDAAQRGCGSEGMRLRGDAAQRGCSSEGMRLRGDTTLSLLSYDDQEQDEFSTTEKASSFLSVLANMTAAYKQEKKKNAKRRTHRSPSVTFKLSEPQYAAGDSPSPKKPKDSLYLSFPVEQISSEDMKTETLAFHLAMGVKVSLILAVFFILLDLILTTVLFTHGSHWSVFREEALNFDLLSSVLDLWGCVLLRAPLLLGACIGVSWNKQDGPPRVSTLSTPVLLLCLVIITFALAKMLMLSEQEPLTHPHLLDLRLLSTRGADLESDREEGGGEESRQKQQKRKRMKDGGLLSVAVLFLLVSAVCEAFIPYYYGKAIDSIVVHQSMEYFAKPVITLSALALVSSLAMGVRGGVFTLMFGKLNLRLRNHLFRTLMRQEIAFFDENHTGDIISRLSADTTQVSDLISNNINVFLRSIVKGIGFFIFMFGMSWKLTLVTIMGFPFIAVVSKLYGDYYKKLTKEVQTTLAEANKVAEETISSMRTVRSFANEEGEADTYLSKLLVMFQLNRKQALAYAGYMWSSCISELALEIAVLYYGGHLVVSGQMSSGSLISFFIYMLELGECLEGVGAAEKVFEYLDREPKHRADGTEAPDTCSGLVEFKDITFAYPTRPDTDILKGVSFTLRPGEVTAVVGPSGSGKSSCVSLLENFYRPQRGEVLLDGKPVHTYQHDYLHSKIGLVGQEPVLFARTVEENITYGLSDVSMEAVEQAATKANAHEFISCLPTGYQTSVGEKGTQLSGGQKQRVAIARALVRNPRVLILDEATSALDADSEHIVQMALNSIMQDHTVLVIAHRLSTVEKADNIIVIESGRVAEQGSHSRLMAREGLYFKLVQRQVLGIETGAEVLNPTQELSWKSDGGQRRRRRRRRKSSSSSSSEAERNMRY